MAGDEDHTTRRRDDEARPALRSHYRPRSRGGRVAVLGYLALMALAEPPFVHGPANRVEPWILGVPFLYAYLFLVYAALIGLLIWVWKREL